VRANGRLNQFQYMDIIHEHLLPFNENKHGSTGNFVFVEDHCGPHRTLKVGRYMALHDVERLDWVLQSPDMNAVGNLWATLEARLRALPQPPTTQDGLFHEQCEEWARLPNSYLSPVWWSIPDRVTALVNARGHSTKYEVYRNKRGLQVTFSQSGLDHSAWCPERPIRS